MQYNDIFDIMEVRESAADDRQDEANGQDGANGINSKGQRITAVKIANPNEDPEINILKSTRLDIHATDEIGQHFIIEMQPSLRATFL